MDSSCSFRFKKYHEFCGELEKLISCPLYTEQAYEAGFGNREGSGTSGGGGFGCWT